VGENYNTQSAAKTPSHRSQPMPTASSEVSSRKISRPPARRTSSRAPRWHDASDDASEDNVLDLRAARRERLAREHHAGSTPGAGTTSEIFAAPTAALSTPAAVARREKVACPPCHWGLTLVTIVLALASIPMIYSASQAIALDNHGNTDFFLIRQIGFVVIGLATMVGVSRLPVKVMRNLAWVFYFVAVLGLLATKFSPLGVTMGSVERWLRVGPIPIQVSEFAKLALIGVLADFWSRAAVPSRKANWPWLVAFVIAGVPLALVFLQPHLSAALVLFAIPLILGFYAGTPLRQIGTLAGVLGVLAAIVFGLCAKGIMPGIKPYQQERIAHFMAKETDEEGAHYQTEQGLRAIERGGWTGAGPGGSLFKQGHLPAPHTDFILAVIGEETGLAGMLVLLAFYGAMIFFCFQIGHGAANPFEMLLCAGVGSLLALQVICNLGVVLDVLPVTGMPLPMMSYGGSGLLCVLVGVGLVLGVSRQSGQSAAEKSSA
jgi:cell division protein FtsW